MLPLLHSMRRQFFLLRLLWSVAECLWRKDCSWLAAREDEQDRDQNNPDQHNTELASQWLRR